MKNLLAVIIISNKILNSVGTNLSFHVAEITQLEFSLQGLSTRLSISATDKHKNYP